VRFIQKGGKAARATLWRRLSRDRSSCSVSDVDAPTLRTRRIRSRRERRRGRASSQAAEAECPAFGDPPRFDDPLYA
jgi:hypothetical protein